jgi:hypothetical protein
VVSARVNLLTKTEDLSNAAWTKSAVTATANQGIAPDGTNTATKLVPNNTTGFHNASQNPTVVAGSVVIIYASLKASGTRYGYVYSDGAAKGSIFDLQTGTITGSIVGAPTANSITDQGNGWWRCSITVTIPSTSASLWISATTSPTSGSSLGDNVNGILVWGTDIRSTTQGVNLPVYQRVNTSTDYDSTGFPVYIKPNGSNQFMQTNSINFSSTDKMTVWQGVRKLSDAAQTMLFETSINSPSNSGTFFITAPNGAAGNYAFLENGGGNLRYTIPVTYSAPITNVLSCGFDLGTTVLADAVVSRINGSLNQTGLLQTAQTTGNFGNYAAYFYARGGSSIFFNGNDYGSIARGAASTAAQITAGETYINSLTKAFAP